jgi:hypothetical protein
MVEEAQGEVDSYCQDCGHDDDFGDIKCPGFEEGAESEEHDADSVIPCQGCGYEVDAGSIICPVCGRGQMRCEHWAESEEDLQEEDTLSENSVSASSMFNGGPRWRRGVFQQLSDSSQIEQGPVQEAQAEQCIGTCWF